VIPIGTDYRLSRTPWTNYTLIAANVLLFVLHFNGADARRHTMDAWLLHPEAPQLVQFFSSVFLHGSWGHLLGNMVFLWVFGNAINDRFGQAGYLAFYLAGGVAAGAGYVLFSGVSPVLGASGAISAVTGAYLVLLPRARVTVLVFLFYLLVPFEVSSLFFLLLQLLFNMFSVYAELAGRGSGVAWWAHISGYAFGIAVAAGMLAVRVLPRDRFDLLNLLRARRRRFGYRRMVAEGFDPFGHAMEAGEGTLSRRVTARSLSTATPDNEMAREMQFRQAAGEACARHDLAGAAEAYLGLVAVSPQAVLPRSQQLDVANQLMSTDHHGEAAGAYEKYLHHYGDGLAGDVHLMLGLLYGRYLQEHDKAREALGKAVRLLRDPRKAELARSELESLGPPGPASAGPGI
jgi:membrane associated rhomboid family serine protease